MTALQKGQPGEAAVGPLSLARFDYRHSTEWSLAMQWKAGLFRASAAKLAYGDRKVSGAFGGAADRCATLRQAVSVGEE